MGSRKNVVEYGILERVGEEWIVGESGESGGID